MRACAWDTNTIFDQHIRRETLHMGIRLTPTLIAPTDRGGSRGFQSESPQRQENKILE